MIRLILLTVILLIPSVASARDYSEWLDMCDEYRLSVESILRCEGVDVKFYYLMVAESKCSPSAVSSKGAEGFWQMMPSTARAYGCDDLSDVECSTRAAAKYIKHLQTMFKYNFDDIISGYNIGGRNYIKHGKTRESQGLVERVKAIMEADR